MFQKRTKKRPRNRLHRVFVLPKAGQILAAMFGGGVLAQGLGPIGFTPDYFAALTVAAGLAFFAPNSWQVECAFRPRRRYAFALAVIFVAAVLMLENGGPFLYFQF